MTVTLDKPTIELRVADRCDTGSCGAQAFVLTMHAAGPLLWCGHHYNQNAHNLREPAIDNRHLINAKPDSPGDEGSTPPEAPAQVPA